MATEVLEVVDTVVKIGLGALISAVAGHFGAKQKFDNEMSKAAIDDSCAILKDAALRFEESSGFLNAAISEYDSIRLKKGHDFSDVLGHALAAYNKGKDAKALCYLIGAADLGKLIETYLAAVQSVRDAVGNVAEKNPPDPSPPPLAKPSEAAGSARAAVLDAIGPAYAKIRGGRL